MIKEEYHVLVRYLVLMVLAFSSSALTAGVREERLENGLRVLLKRVDGIPIVSVWSWVHAGSANEHTGITGAAHWCEHMNFKGTEKYSRDEMKNLLERVGGAWNGYTWLDQTTYYQTVPSDALELALDIEAQRLTSSLFTPEDVKAERTVILSELRMGENDPENILDIETTAAAIKAHPYHWPTIGWQSDIESMTRDDLYGFYRNYYSPNNTTLVVVGDFAEESALEMIRKKFGGIPRGPEIERLHTVEPEQLGERRVVLEKGGSTPYLLLAYHTPTIDSEDFFPLLALDTLLGGGESVNLYNVSWRGQASRSSRLYRGLVDEKLAAKAGSLYLPTKYPCLFYLYATASPGVDLARLERETLSIVNNVKEGEIAEGEFQKVITQLKARFIYDSDSVTEQAHMLGFFDTLGDYTFSRSFLENIGKVKKKDISRVALKYLTERNRTVGWYLPAGKCAAESKLPSPGSTGAHSRGPAGYSGSPFSSLGEKLRNLVPWRREKKDRAVTGRRRGAKYKTRWSKVSVSVPTRVMLDATRKVLPNGLTLIVRENHISPSVVAYVDIGAGSAYDSAGKHGLANFTARMLDRGSVGMSAALVADVLDSSGTELQITCGRDRAAVTAQMLSEKMPMILEVLAQMVEDPVFPTSEIEKIRGQITVGLEEDSHDTRKAAVDGVYMLIYPLGHPYRHKVKGDVKSVDSIRRRDMVEFYETHYGPRVTTIVLSGDVERKEAERLVEKYFGGWKARRPLSSPTVLTPPLLLEEKQEKIKIPDKTQIDIALGFRGIKRANPDYYAVRVMNTVLGRFGMGGRLGRRIREDLGLAYYAYSTFITYRHVGPFLVRAGVSPDNADKAVSEIRAGLCKMIEKGVTSRELEESKEYIIRSLPRQLETNDAVAAALANIEFYNLGLDYFERLPEIIGGISRKDAHRVARKYLHPESCAVILAGPVD